MASKHGARTHKNKPPCQSPRHDQNHLNAYSGVLNKRTNVCDKCRRSPSSSANTNSSNSSIISESNSNEKQSSTPQPTFPIDNDNSINNSNNMDISSPASTPKRGRLRRLSKTPTTANDTAAFNDSTHLQASSDSPLSNSSKFSSSMQIENELQLPPTLSQSSFPSTYPS
jgi:hypothetical protein